MINIGILGCGAITQARHAPEYFSNPHCGKLYFYDVDGHKAAELAAKYGGTAVHSPDDLFADPSIDAVSICTPNFTHYAYTMAALEQGKHVLCEKPMACSVEEAVKMKACAEEAGKTLMVGFCQRFFPAHVEAKKLLESGEMGRVLSFRTAFKHSGPEYWSKDRNVWFFDGKKAGFGVFGDLGTHKADLMAWLLDTKFTNILGRTYVADKKKSNGEKIDVEDNAIFIIECANGVFGSLEVSWTCYGPDEHATVLYCKNGVIKLYCDTEYDFIVQKMDKSEVRRNLGGCSTNEKQQSSGVIDEFVDCIVTGRRPVISVEDAIHSMEVLEMAKGIE